MKGFGLQATSRIKAFVFKFILVPAKWIKTARQYILHARTELKYGDMIRINDDCFEGDWAFVSNRRRGQQKEHWPQFGNAFDGFIAFADVGARGQMIPDGDFMRMNKLASNDERRFLFSLMIMGGSALAIADQYDTISEHAWVYQNPEMNILNELGFAAKYSVKLKPHECKIIRIKHHLLKLEAETASMRRGAKSSK